MDYLLTIAPNTARSGAPEGTALARERAEISAEHGPYHAKLASSGCLLDGARLRPPSEAVRVTRRGGATKFVDGPFTEAKEVIGGYYLLRTDTLDEAVALFCSCPMRDGDVVSLQPLVGGPSAELTAEGAKNAALPGEQFLLLVSSSEHDVAAWTRAMDRVEQEAEVVPRLREAKAFIAGGRLGDARAVRSMTMRCGDRLVSDGPFAEAKEIIGGFLRIRCASPGEASKWAERWSGSLHGAVDVFPVWLM